MTEPDRKPASGQGASAGCGGAGAAPASALSRRHALQAMLGGAGVLALPPGTVLAFDRTGASDPDKQLRWLGQQLEARFAEYRNTAKAYHDLVQASHGDFASEDGIYRSARALVAAPALKHLREVMESRWQTTAATVEDILALPVHTLLGLAVRARAIGLSVYGRAEARCDATGVDLTDAQIGWWPIYRVRQLLQDIEAVAAGGAA